MYNSIAGTSVTLKQLEVFNAVVSTGSISLAARRIGLAQPTISQQLAKMEQTLGTQLLIRNRPPNLELTPAGEYWYRCSTRILAEMNAISIRHNQEFADQRTLMRFGTTPGLGGHFLRYAAEIAVNESRFSKVESVWAPSSDDLVEMLNLHQLDCAVVSASSVEGYGASLNITPLFEERIAWVLPSSVPEEVVTETLVSRRLADERYSALTRFVDVGTQTPWHSFSAKWYQNNLPFAHPYFSCPTHSLAIEFVIAGLATCHSPMSVFSTLHPTIAESLRSYELQDVSRVAVLAMPRHLLSLASFVTFRDRMLEFGSSRLGASGDPIPSMRAGLAPSRGPANGQATAISAPSR